MRARLPESTHPARAPLAHAEDVLGRCLEPLFLLLLRMEHASCAEAAERLHARCCREIEAFQSAARALALPEHDIEASSYALVALLDDVALQREGPIQAHWRSHSLMQRYQHAGTDDDFYEKLARLRGRPDQSHILRVFYLCLMLGFRGDSTSCRSELARFELADGIRRELEHSHALSARLELSPCQRAASARRRVLPQHRYLWLLVVLAAAGVLLYLVLRLRQAAAAHSASARESQPCVGHS
jgi:type VI secretion system protein ImpK